MRRTLNETLKLLLAKALKLHTKAEKENWLGITPSEAKETINKLEEKIAALGVGTSTKEAVADLLKLANPKLVIRKKFIIGSGRDDDKVAFQRGLVVVPLKNPNSHDYKLGKPAIFCESDRCVAIRESRYSVGNHMTTEKKSLRLATPAEIKKFFADIAKGEVTSDGKAYLENALG